MLMARLRRLTVLLEPLKACGTLAPGVAELVSLGLQPSAARSSEAGQGDTLAHLGGLFLPGGRNWEVSMCGS